MEAPSQPTSKSFPSKNASRKQASKRTRYRTGKWTEEETKYASQIIRCFGLGVVKLPSNKTLRAYLSGQLDCDPMRITKKFPGTALLMKELSDDSRPEPQQSVVQNELLKLESLKQSFRERLHYDELKQRSRPSVFSLVDDVTDVKNPPCSPTFGAPVSADIVQPTTNVNMNAMQAPGTGMIGTLGANPATQFHGVAAQAEQQAVQTAVGSMDLGFLLSATPGSSMAAALANPTTLAQLWILQEQQEVQVQSQRAVLMQLGSPGLALGSTSRAVTLPMNNKDICHALAPTPQSTFTMNNAASVLFKNCLPSFQPTLASHPQHLATNIQPVANFFAPNIHSGTAPAPSANTGCPNPNGMNTNPFFMNLANVVSAAAAASQCVAMGTATVTAPVSRAPSPGVLNSHAESGTQCANSCLPGWPVGMTSNV